MSVRNIYHFLNKFAYLLNLIKTIVILAITNNTLEKELSIYISERYFLLKTHNNAPYSTEILNIQKLRNRSMYIFMLPFVKENFNSDKKLLYLS